MTFMVVASVETTTTFRDACLIFCMFDMTCHGKEMLE